MEKFYTKTAPVVITALSVVGLIVSLYLTIAHYTSSHILICSSSGFVNCNAVTTSPESYLFGIPVATLGVLYFIILLGLSNPWVWRRNTSWVLPLVRILVTTAGIGMVVYLVYSELLVIGSICLYCTSIHIISLIIWVITLPSSTYLIQQSSSSK